MIGHRPVAVAVEPADARAVRPPRGSCNEARVTIRQHDTRVSLESGVAGHCQGGADSDRYYRLGQIYCYLETDRDDNVTREVQNDEILTPIDCCATE